MTVRTSSQDTFTIGDEFQLNTYSTDDQNYHFVTALSNGNFIASWESYGQDGDQRGIFAQLFDASGSAIGVEIAVNEITSNFQTDIRMIELSNGGFVIGWADTSLRTNSDPYAYQGVFRVFTADGTPITGDIVGASRIGQYDYMDMTPLPGGGFLVAWSAGDYLTNIQSFDVDGVAIGEQLVINSDLWVSTPRITILADGGYVVVWDSGETSAFSHSIRSATFSADGTPLSVNSSVSGFIEGARSNDPIVVTALSDGGYIVTWPNWDGDRPNGDRLDIYGRFYDSAGTPVSSVLQINTTSPEDQFDAQVAALSDGGCVVTWSSYDPDRANVYAQIYDSQGTKVGGEITVTTHVDGSPWEQSVAALDSGGFVITWSSYLNDSTDIYMQVFDADGTKIGTQTGVNPNATYHQTHPNVAVLADGNLAVTWESDLQDGDEFGLFGQIVAVNDVSTGAPVIMGIAGTGSPLVADTSSIADEDGLGTFSYQWHRDGVDVNGQTRARYIVGEDDLDSELTVTVTYIDGNGTIETITSDATDPVTLFRIKGDNSANTIEGSDDANIIFGYGGADTLSGLGGNDTLIGGVRDDTLYGGDDNDLLRGDLNDDTLIGGAGVDRMVGGRGNDVQTGGADSDVFMFRGADFGADILTDFEMGVDRLALSETVDTSTDIASNGNGDAVLALSQGTITFEGITAAELITYFD